MQKLHENFIKLMRDDIVQTATKGIIDNYTKLEVQDIVTFDQDAHKHRR